MALIPPFFLDTIVAIGIGDDPSTRSWIGTGFLYGLFAEELEDSKKTYNIFLISNKHVLKGNKNVWLKFNSAIDETSEDYKIGLVARNGRSLWIGHPDPAIDMGALFINAKALKDENRRFSYFKSDEHISDSTQMKSKGVTEGDGIYILGFPMGMVESSRQYAICRSGCIARIRDNLDGISKEFLVDAFVFPGNSGGPVVLQPSAIAIEGTKAINKADLIGIVQSYVPYKDIAMSRQTGKPRIMFEENSGLASVISAEYINETAVIARKRLKSRISNAKRRKAKKKNH